MKKWLIFVIGLITGFFLTIIVGFIIVSSSSDSHIKEYQHPKVFTIATKFKVFQVFEGGALAHCETKTGDMAYFMNGPIVCIKAEGDNLFYDDQIIEVPEGREILQIGTFSYQTKLTEKVVPYIVIP